MIPIKQISYVCQQRNILKQWSGEFVLAWDCLGFIHHFVIKNSLPRVNSSYIWVLENSQDKNLIYGKMRKSLMNLLSSRCLAQKLSIWGSLQYAIAWKMITFYVLLGYNCQVRRKSGVENEESNKLIRLKIIKFDLFCLHSSCSPSTVHAQAKGVNSWGEAPPMQPK